ncbi:MAG: class I tRNA ligase family protein [Patescibacteria group bacterium]
MKYDHKKIEKKWQKIWLKEDVYEPNLKGAKKPLDKARGKPFYNLMMFPYPSAEGLHVGNMYAFVGSDIYGRLKRMQGHDVFEPIGLDGFGIHSENYAIKIGQHPADQAKISEKNFYRQLEMIGNGFAWNEKLETYDPEYYRWTQWIFIQLYKKGLAYRKKASVNWCPGCLTVLADEQVIGGECERCGAKVIKKELEQWFFKITDYAERLLKNLEYIDWSEKVKVAQRNWIGRSDGALLSFKIQDTSCKIDIFTTRPDTLFGVTYMVLAPEHDLISSHKLQVTNLKEVEDYVKETKNKSEADRISNGRDKTGIELKGVTAINPANQKEIPVWVADYVLGNVGTGAIMAVPAHDERDMEFAKKFNLPISDASLVSIEEGIKKSGGKKTIQYRLRDWLISRQRYWGPPIPMIHCQDCDWQPVPEEDLPVKLPYIKNFRPTGTNQSPLAADEEFYKVKCPKCGDSARRETDVSDTFLDSAWYYIGYLNLKKPFDKLREAKWLPVNMYIGGAEHSVLHLLYVRFLAMVFHDLRMVQFEEPFPKFRAHGLIIKDGFKMSKSKGNVINPDEYINKYGADALRMYLMFLGPFDQGGDFNDNGIKGLTRFLERVWRLSTKLQITNYKQIPNSKIQKTVHKTIKKVTEDIENLQYNTAISALMILLNELEENQSEISQVELKIFVKLLSPFAPHMAEEIWRGVLKNKESIHLSAWPEYDSELIKKDVADIIIQVNGKTRVIIKVKINTSQKEIEELAQAEENVNKHISGKVKKIIFVKDKLVNFVV